ncbi:MAG: hypothetical protein M1817_004337 [Caeruleum heppii]|nr:MAG: hypothetical protein M1817_004337 [Caeruleum heppii]
MYFSSCIVLQVVATTLMLAPTQAAPVKEGGLTKRSMAPELSANYRRAGSSWFEPDPSDQTRVVRREEPLYSAAVMPATFPLNGIHCHYPALPAPTALDPQGNPIYQTNSGPKVWSKELIQGAIEAGLSMLQEFAGRYQALADVDVNTGEVLFGTYRNVPKLPVHRFFGRNKKFKPWASTCNGASDDLWEYPLVNNAEVYWEEALPGDRRAMGNLPERGNTRVIFDSKGGYCGLVQHPSKQVNLLYKSCDVYASVGTSLTLTGNPSQNNLYSLPPPVLPT